MTNYPVPFLVLALSLSGLASPLSANYIDTNTGREWRSLTETVGFSWNQLVSISDANGNLSGSLKSGVTSLTVDFTGWHFASNEDVYALFQSAGVTCTFAQSYCEESNSSWAPELISNLGQTFFYLEQPALTGLTSTSNSDPSNLALLGEVINWVSEEEKDRASWYAAAYSKEAAADFMGAFLYRTASVPNPDPSVPAPSTLLLLGAALPVFGWTARKKMKR